MRKAIAQILIVSILAVSLIGVFSNPAQAEFSTTPAIAAGGDHSLALKQDGTVWAWGDNNDGQLGDGTTERRYTPTQVPGLTDVVAIAAGYYHSLALRQDGTVWAWGDNSHGQLGDGGSQDRYTPAQVPGLTNVIAISAGRYHSLVLKQDGTVWGWGNNSAGELGDGRSATTKRTPVQAQGLTNVIAIAAGFDRSYAIKQDGTVWGWGFGGLGDGKEQHSYVPIQIPALTDAIAISSEFLAAHAVKQDGTVWGWAIMNASGLVGDGTTEDRLTPVQLPGLIDIVTVSNKYTHALALKSDGTVWAWGVNGSGQLGDGTTSSKYAPIQVSGLTDVIAISVGKYHSLVLKQDGTVWSWGSNSYGQLGDGTTENKYTPVQISETYDIGLTFNELDSKCFSNMEGRSIISITGSAADLEGRTVTATLEQIETEGIPVKLSKETVVQEGMFNIVFDVKGDVDTPEIPEGKYKVTVKITETNYFQLF